MKAFDPLKEYRDAIKAIDPLKEYRDALRAIDPLKEYREAITAADPLKEYREAAKAFDPLGSFRDSMKAFDPLGSLRDSITAFDPLKEYRDRVDALDALKLYEKRMDALGVLNPLESFRERMDAFSSVATYREAMSAFDSMKALRDAITTFDSLKTYHAAMEAMNVKGPKEIDEILESISSFSLDSAYRNVSSNLTVNGDGSVAFGAASLNLEEVRSIANSAFETATVRHSTSPSQVVESLIFVIQGAKDPLHQKLLTWLIFPIIVGIIFSIVNPIADFYIKDYLERNKRAEKKTINESVRMLVDSTDVLRNYRFVGAKKLEVRTNGAMNSPVIATLYFGQTVEVLERRKSWTLVNWTDHESKAQIQGWVLSRYLEKFN